MAAGRSTSGRLTKAGCRASRVGRPSHALLWRGGVQGGQRGRTGESKPPAAGGGGCVPGPPRHQTCCARPAPLPAKPLIAGHPAGALVAASRQRASPSPAGWWTPHSLQQRSRSWGPWSRSAVVGPGDGVHAVKTSAHHRPCPRRALLQCTKRSQWHEGLLPSTRGTLATFARIRKDALHASRPTPVSTASKRARCAAVWNCCLRWRLWALNIAPRSTLTPGLSLERPASTYGCMGAMCSPKDGPRNPAALCWAWRPGV